MGAYLNGIYYEHTDPMELSRRATSLKAEAAVQHDRIESATRRAYRTALDADDDPAPLETRETLNDAIGALLLDLGKAYGLSVRLDDPRSKRIVDALSAMPGDGR